MTGVTVEQKRMMGVNSGLELITLPHGSQLRQDLLERHHLLALGVAVDVLGCTGTVNQRALVLHKAIQLAQALRSTAHDLYALSAVMKALEMPQVRVHRLKITYSAELGWAFRIEFSKVFLTIYTHAGTHSLVLLTFVFAITNQAESPHNTNHRKCFTTGWKPLSMENRGLN